MISGAPRRVGTMFMKIIDGFENYAITSNGKVFNVNTMEEKIPTDNQRGYLYVDLYNSGKRKRFYVHRLVAQYFIENPMRKPFVNHKDGNTKNNFVQNLEWCTPAENVEHASKVLKVMECYNNANYKKHIVKLIEDFNKKNKTDLVKILEDERDGKVKMSWCYVEEVE